MQERYHTIMDIGEAMLVCGAEVHRVEDSLCRMFRASGAERTDVFIITSSMVVTVHTPDAPPFTETRRIQNSETDFERLHQLNALSRALCQQDLPTKEIQTRFLGISHAKPYPRWLISLCYALISGSFTLFFGGGWIEAVVAMVTGIAVSGVTLLSDRWIHNKIFVKFTASLVATALAYVAMRLSVISSIDKVLIGNIMTLIPGTGLTNAIRDLFIGDSIAGLLRTIEACIAALAIAAGYFVVVFVTGGAML